MNIKEMFKNKKIRTAVIAAVAVVVIGGGAIAVSAVTAPYALDKNGEKIKEAYNVCIDGEPIALVATEEEANAFIDDIKYYYVKDKDDVEKISVKEELTVEQAVLERNGKHPTVSDLDEVLDEVINGTNEKTSYKVKKGDTASEIAADLGIAFSKLKKWNKGKDLDELQIGDELKTYEKNPMVHVTTVEKTTYTKKIKYKTKYIKTSKLYEGETKVKKKGKYGKKKVTAKVTKVNGETASTKVLSTKTLKKPVTAVVYKGTKAQGSNVVDYAMKFLGNPYVYGGSSLTNGTDCSGFTMAVYAHFGYSLPHNSWAQLNCGREVSYADAKPGDLIIYSNHVAIYAGGGMIVHASNYNTGITTNSATYRSIIGVRRIID